MERRRAATAAVTVIAGVLGLGATLGLFGMTEPDSQGGSHTPVAVAAQTDSFGGPTGAAASAMPDD